MLSSNTALQISKYLPLLASDKSGEVVAAAAAMNRALHRDGLDIHDVVAAVQRGWSAPTIRHAPPMKPWQRLARDCLALGCANLSPSERNFLVSIANWPDPLSQRQERWLSAIAAALQGGVA